MYSILAATRSSRPALQSTRLLDQVRERIRYLHYSLRTEQAYLLWVRAFIRHHGLRHPRTLGGPEVESFLNALVNQRNVSASTHKQALCALLFLYREVLDQDLPWMQQIQRPAVRKHMPAVLTVAQTRDVLDRMDADRGDLTRIRQLGKVTCPGAYGAAACRPRSTRRGSGPPLDRHWTEKGDRSRRAVALRRRQGPDAARRPRGRPAGSRGRARAVTGRTACPPPRS